MTSDMRQKIIGQVREGLCKEVLLKLIRNRRSETGMGRAFLTYCETRAKREVLK